MVKNVLITGARAPVALEWARRLQRAGAKVTLADSLNWPIGRFSNAAVRYVQIEKPKTNPAGFFRDLKRTIREHNIQVLLPTCEEIFFIAAYKKELSNLCTVFCDDLMVLKKLHHKYYMLESTANCGALLPKTIMLTSKSHVDNFQDNYNHKNWICKPVYSRFGCQTQLNLSDEFLDNLNPTYEHPWVAQEKLDGIEYCSYSIALDGKLVVHACYQPKYRAGVGAGVFFDPVKHEQVLEFVQKFVSRHEFTGQIGFDFIDTDEGLCVIECNPRATSGLHVLPHDVDLWPILNGRISEKLIEADLEPRAIKVAMLLYAVSGIRAKGFKNWLRDYQSCRDVVSEKNDRMPQYGQLISLVETLTAGIKSLGSLREGSTADIEWNGEPIR